MRTGKFSFDIAGQFHRDALLEHGKRSHMTRISSTFPRYLLVLISSFLLLAGMAWSADDKDESDINKRLDASAKVLDEVMATPDKAIPDKVMSDAKCVAVIPSMVKVALGFRLISVPSFARSSLGRSSALS